VTLLASKRLALGLLIGLALALIPETLGLEPTAFRLCRRILLAALSINLLVCTVSQWRRFSGSVVLIHAGILAIIAGGVVGHLGYVATVNIHEGSATATAFRWDRQEDSDLGFTLEVTRIHRDYYPTGLRVGVRIDGEPVALCEFTTGESTTCAGMAIEALSFEPAPPALRLAVTPPGGARSEVVATNQEGGQQGGTVFQLVGFKTPAVRRTWVDLLITLPAVPPVGGVAEVNHPFVWQGLRFFHTGGGIDPSGRPYAGIQIVKDLGIPMVYAGFALLAVGNFLLLSRRISGHRRHRHVIC